MNVRRILMVLGPMAALLPMASPVLAQDKADRMKAFFERADANHDGMLSLEEWTAAGRRSRGFEMVDANHDGQVTPDELRAAAAKWGR